MKALSVLVQRSPLTSFFFLAFILSWGLGAAVRGTPLELIAPDQVFIGGVLVAALIVVALSDGRAGLGDLGRRLLRWRVGVHWYAVVFALPVALVGAVALLIPVLGGSALEWTKTPALTTTALMFAVFMLLPLGAPLGEEIGWRGLALPRLLARRSPLTASLVLGVIWSLWHVPVVMADPALRVPTPFFLQVVPLSVLVSWIFMHTRGSLFVAVLFHAWFDLVLLFVGAMIAPSDYALMWWLIVGIQTVAALAAVAVDRRPFIGRTSERSPNAAAAIAAG
jgi:membrane protease YdiL (CAAX protease family)